MKDEIFDDPLGKDGRANGAGYADDEADEVGHVVSWGVADVHADVGPVPVEPGQNEHKELGAEKDVERFRGALTASLGRHQVRQISQDKGHGQHLVEYFEALSGKAFAEFQAQHAVGGKRQGEQGETQLQAA